MARRLTSLLLVLAAGGCCPPGSHMPDIVLVTLDTTRADHLGCYGYFRQTTPFLNRFAQRSIVFEDAIVPMATTLPTHTSILTGTYPLEHGVLANLAHTGHYFEPSAGLRSLAEICRDAGYQTAAFVSAVPLKRGSGIEAGFDHFVEPPPDDRERSAGETTRLVLEWLDEQEERPMFLWVHYYDPHWPYEAPEEYRIFEADDALDGWLEERRIPRRIFRKKAGKSEVSRESHNLYDAELRYLDHNLEQLFKRLRRRNRWTRTATLIVGDHGEALCQHGRTGHGWTWNEQVQAPMFLKIPGEKPRRVPWTVSVVDAIPTLLGRVRVPELDEFLEQARGRDVLAPSFKPAPILSQDTGVRIDHPGALVYHHALTGDRWKLIRIESKVPDEERGGRPGVRYRLFDRIADPHELIDLSAEMPELVQELDRQLEEMLESQRRHAELLGGGGRSARRADDELIDKLTGLGYMEGADEESDDDPDEDPGGESGGESSAEPDER